MISKQFLEDLVKKIWSKIKAFPALWSPHPFLQPILLIVHWFTYPGSRGPFWNWEIFACGIRKAGLWNPKYSSNDWNLESNLKSKYHWQNSESSNLESGIHGMESRIQDHLEANWYCWEKWAIALSGHVTSFLWKWKSRGENVIFKIMNYLFLNTIFALKLQENVERWRGNVYSTSQRNYQKFNKI